MLWAMPPSSPKPPKSDDPKRRSVYSDSRVTVAFPFSTVRVGGDDRLATLAALVADLADEVRRVADSPASVELSSRARALAEELR